MNKHAITLILLAASAVSASAQGRILPVTEMPVSAETLAAGNAMHSSTDTYIYADPALAFDSESRWHAVYSAALLPSNDGTHSLHTLSAAARFGSNAVFVGARYHDMGTMKTFVDNDMNETQHGSMSLSAYTVDAGYARLLTPNIAAWATAGLASEKTSATIFAVRMALGADYSGIASLAGKPLSYSAGLSASNLGRYSYTGKSGMLSPRVGIGGHAVWQTAEGQSLALTVDGGMYMKTDDTKQSAELSGGIAYTAFSNYTLRIGGHTGDKDDYAAAGFSIAMKWITLHATAKIPLRNNLDAVYMAGLAVNL